MAETMNGANIPTLDEGKDGIDAQGTGQIRIMKSLAVSASVLGANERKLYIQDIKKYEMIETLLPFFTMSYMDTNKIDKGSRNSATACFTYLTGARKQELLFINGLEGLILEDFVKGFTVGGKIFKDKITTDKDWEKKYFTKKGKRFTPLEAFERALLQEILVYTLSAKDKRPVVAKEEATQKSQADIDRLALEIATMFA